jgi:hypothetical protein
MARLSTTQRGYGYLHQKMRERLKPMVEAGMTNCARCGDRILPGQRWELDHAAGKQGYRGPAHWRCNRSAGGRIGAAITNGKSRGWLRQW